MKRYFQAYLSVVLWMAVIFIGSTDVGSSQNTSRIIGPILRWFKPDVSDATIRGVQAVVRKSAHVVIYAILAALLWRAQRIVRGNGNEWRWVEFWWIVAVCCLYAISDELHQSFVSSRQGSIYDVMFDTTGAVLALLAIRFVQRYSKPDHNIAASLGSPSPSR